MDWSEISAVAVTLFFVMDPLGNIPVFNAVLARFETRRRSVIVARELVFALLILLVFLFAGNTIMGFLGLSQSSLSLAGGILLFVIAIRMIFPRQGAEEEPEEDPFIVPLAMPLVASSEPERIWEWCTALTLAWSASFVILACSPWVMKVLGDRGVRALERLMGMLLILLAIQMFLNGLQEFLASIS